MTWTPLKISVGATPEEAFAAGAIHSHDSQVILLAWVKGVGWCGCRGVPSDYLAPVPDTDTLLLRIDDTLICAVDVGHSKRNIVI